MADGFSLQDLLGLSGNATTALQQGLAQYLGNQQTQQQMAANQQAMAIQQAQFQQAQQAAAAQQQQQQAYQDAVGKFVQNPTSEGAANLQLQFPEQSKAIQQSWQTRDAANQAADMQGLATVYSYVKNGQPDAAKSYLQQRLDADKVAGKSEPVVQHLLDSFDQDPSGKHALGMSAMFLSLSPNGGKFAKTLSSLDGSDAEKTHVIGAGGALVDDTGKELYRAPTADSYKILKNADGSEVLYQVGGAQGSQGQRYTGGWTPRQRNGGDNSDAAVNAKINGAAKYLGVDPSADISKMSPVQIAQAMTLSEGGAGSLADRNNNPANLRNPDGSYKSFPTKQAGLNAAAALVAKKLKNGQTTVQSLIEGLPVGVTQGDASGGARVVATSKGGDPASIEGQAQAIANGGAAPLTGRSAVTGLGAQIMARVYELNPSYDAKIYAPRVAALKSFTSGADSKTVQALNNATQHLAQLGTLVDALRNGDNRTFNRVGNYFSTEFGGTAPTDFQAVKQMVGGELAKVIAGGVSGEGDRQEASKWLNEANTPAQLKSAIERVKGLLGSQFHTLQNKYETGTGKKDFLNLVVPDVKNAWANEGHASAPAPAPAASATTKPNPFGAAPAGATRKIHNSHTGQTLYLVNGKWVAG